METSYLGIILMINKIFQSVVIFYIKQLED